MDSGIAGLEVRVGIVWFVVGLRGCNKEDCDHWWWEYTKEGLGGIAWLSIHGKTLKILEEVGLHE